MVSAYTWNPTNTLFEDIELVEFIGTTGTVVTVIPRIPIAPPGIADIYTIHSVNVISGTIPSDLIINISGDHFTIKSKFADMFYRTIKYITQDQDLTVHDNIVHRFADVPTHFTGIYQYIPPPSDYMDIVFAVQVTGSVSGSFTSNWTVSLRHDWTSSNTQLATLCSLGTGVIE